MVCLEWLKEDPAQTAEISQTLKIRFVFLMEVFALTRFTGEQLQWIITRYLMINYAVKNKLQTVETLMTYPICFQQYQCNPVTCCHLKYHCWKENPATKSGDIIMKHTFITSFDFKYVSNLGIQGLFWVSLISVFKVPCKKHWYYAN